MSLILSSGMVPCDLPASQLPTCAEADGKMKRRLQETEQGEAGRSQDIATIPHFSMGHHARGSSLVHGGINSVVQKAMIKEYFWFDLTRSRLLYCHLK